MENEYEELRGQQTGASLEHSFFEPFPPSIGRLFRTRSLGKLAIALVVRVT